MPRTELYGKHVDHAALAAGDYESPDEYADQGDTRVVKDLLFSYLISSSDALGNDVLVAADVRRDEEVTIEQIGLVSLRKGESNHSFYTTQELERIKNPGAGLEVVTAEADVSALGEFELSEWLKTQNPETGREPTIDEVLERVGDDKELAHRMLQAENIATDGEPRKGLELGLSNIIRS